MYWSRCLLWLLLASGVRAESAGYLLGGGLESASDDGWRVAVLASVGLTQDTWLSASASSSRVEVPLRGDSDVVSADIELDHYFDPIGFTIGAAYWGDPDLLDSNDLRASLYFRSDKLTLGTEFETRDFDFTIPPTDYFAGRELTFDANGVGARARFKTGQSFSIGLSAMQYDYSVDFVPNENRDALRLITVSRLGLINNLIDSRASIDFALDAGPRRWELDFSTWEGALDQARTRSFTLRMLTPLNEATDLELGLGYDDSELYGDVTFLSIYLYFYGS
ncbi:MAG: hypothetical protein OEW64_10100 [Gammaproteobacteria bacterium]|nr:hypothetical protein [Gammaproteobacteria bacterium]MDH5304434.1 hypothetical protein [Gammaproteobacteria bacterium]MDH5322216.1 hypothetical protein [Gammaproteobacteria bacterium]